MLYVRKVRRAPFLTVDENHISFAVNACPNVHTTKYKKKRPLTGLFAIYPKLLPQLLQCHVLLTLPAANTPNNATFPILEAPLIFLQSVDWQKGQVTGFKN